MKANSLSLSLSAYCAHITDQAVLPLDLQFTNDGERRNYEANIAATMATFGELSRGLDVNVRFSGYVGARLSLTGIL